MKLSKMRAEIVGIPLTPFQQIKFDEYLDRHVRKGAMSEEEAIERSASADNMVASINGRDYGVNSMTGRLARQGYALVPDTEGKTKVVRKALTPEQREAKLSKLQAQIAKLEGAK